MSNPIMSPHSFANNFEIFSNEKPNVENILSEGVEILDYDNMKNVKSHANLTKGIGINKDI